jgi:putative transposase
MSTYRRYREPGATVFLTIATWQRSPIFHGTGAVERLRRALRVVMAESPFVFEAAVILPDHLHFLWTMPDGDSNYSKRAGRMKALFTRDADGEPSPLTVRREASNWQPRFIEHTIRDEADFKNHLDYIHYNPVRHGLCRCAHEWPYSSFKKWCGIGEYEHSWGCHCNSGNAPVIGSVEDCESLG